MKTALGAALLVVLAAVLGASCGPLGGGCKRLGCANGRVCNEATDTCEKGGGGGGGGTGTGGGAAGGAGGGLGGGGGSGGGGGGSGGSGGSGGGGGTVLYPDGGYPNCLTRVVGARTCTTDCPPGFHCASGECRLNGGDAPLQVTLRWDTFEDFDLHVIEPVIGSDAGTDGGVDGGTDGGSGSGTCEVYYGDRNTASTPSACGALGSLDLDSEPGCPTPPDGVEIENVVYPNTRSPVPGTYVVRVSHYRACAVQLQQAGYMVEVRKGTQSTGLCGVFRRTDPDFGNDTPRTVMSFTYP